MLQAYKINNIPITQIKNWSISMLDGNDSFIVSDGATSWNYNEKDNKVIITNYDNEENKITHYTSSRNRKS